MFLCELDTLEVDCLTLQNDRNAVRSKWPTVEIPYVISSDLGTNHITGPLYLASHRNLCACKHHILVMITLNRSATRSRLLDALTWCRSLSDKDLIIVHQPFCCSCASYVGFISGEQSLFVGPLCIVGNIVHEILHALGFHHEHTRKDRTQHIKILSHNIMKGNEKNFAMQDGETFGLSYDTKSIMHYGSGYFSVNGLPTIVPLVEVDNMGQRVKMTEADIQRVRRLYNCGMSTVYFTGIYWP
uniref:Metalloendopeptidase n=1 Tax=Mola mola TaxID=94237 RepID=A0A3Q3WN55_MOLML